MTLNARLLREIGIYFFFDFEVFRGFFRGFSRFFEVFRGFFRGFSRFWGVYFRRYSRFSELSSRSSEVFEASVHWK